MEPPLTTTSTPTPTTTYIDDMDSTCSTPYVSAPSSPGREPPSCGGVGGGGGYHYYYSAPASPMHFLISSQNQIPFSSEKSTSDFNDFDFSATLTNPGFGGGLTSSGPMSSADELFFNGQIRPMKLSSHLQRPQMLTPLIDGDENDEDFDENVENMENDDVGIVRGRDMKLRSHSLRRRTRSLSPLRSTTSFDWHQENDDFAPHQQNDHFAPDDEEIVVETEEVGNGDGEGGQIGEGVKLPETTTSGSSSRSSSVGRSSKRWVLLKEFLYRSKSEGRNNGQRFWGNLSFSPVTKDKKVDKLEKMEKCEEKLKIPKMKSFSKVNTNNSGTEGVKKKRVNGVMGKRRMGAHEIHYTANRAQAEEMRKKTFLPYRQGLLGCLGFSSRSYGAWNGFTRALNPVSSS